MPAVRNAWFTWLAESVQKDRLSRRQGMVTRERQRRRGGGGGDAPRRRDVRAGSSKEGGRADGRRSPRYLCGGWEVSDPAQTILETGVQISEQGLGVHI